MTCNVSFQVLWRHIYVSCTGEFACVPRAILSYLFAFHTHCWNSAVSHSLASLPLLGSLGGICLCPSFSGISNNCPQSPTKPWASTFQLLHSLRILHSCLVPPEPCYVFVFEMRRIPSSVFFLTHTVVVGWQMNH